jgi:hypothetical protein
MVAVRRKTMISRADIRSHYVGYWGDSDREAQFSKDKYAIGVLKWNASPATPMALL